MASRKHGHTTRINISSAIPITTATATAATAASMEVFDDIVTAIWSLDVAENRIQIVRDSKGTIALSAWIAKTRNSNVGRVTRIILSVWSFDAIENISQIVR
jgi:hypothetical protein